LTTRRPTTGSTGSLRHLGFSFHDKAEAFPGIVNAYAGWTFCQIQYNYMDAEYQAGTKGLEYAAAQGLAVIAMEPLRGGALANPPSAVRRILASLPGNRSPAEWGLQWVWNHPGVSLLLSGMSSLPQVVENLQAAEEAEINSLQAGELALITRARKKFEERTAIPCTSCGYCMPCPNGVNIPLNFELYNTAERYEDLAGSRFRYQRFMADGEKAIACTGCRSCEEKCPQKISVSEWMPKVAAALEVDQK